MRRNGSSAILKTAFIALRPTRIIRACTALAIAFPFFITGCTSLPQNTGKRSTALPPAEEGRLALALSGMTAKHPGLSGVTPLAIGADAFAARMLLTDAATTSIDAQYYIWRTDLTGYLLLDRIKQAADRGVRVRILLDDHGTSGLDSEIAALQSHPNIEVRLWNPFKLRLFKMFSYVFDFSRLNHRMHNKSFTVDGRAAILGGRNVADEYFSTGKTPIFVDLDVLVVGAVVSDISNDFDRYWNCTSSYPADQFLVDSTWNNSIATGLNSFSNTKQMEEYRDILEQSNIVKQLYSGTLDLEWTKATLISDDPAKGHAKIPNKDLISGQMARAVGTIKHRFDGVSAYFVPGTEGIKIFTALKEQGIQVRMLTNSLEATDVLPVHAGYAKRRKCLLNNGIELFELRRQASVDAPITKMGHLGVSGASLHAKTFAVDGQRIFIGSFNFDPRSATINTEMGILIDSENMAQSLHQAFDYGFGGMAWQVKQIEKDLVWVEPDNPDTPALTKEPGGGFFRNIILKIISWMPVEWLL